MFSSKRCNAAFVSNVRTPAVRFQRFWCSVGGFPYLSEQLKGVLYGLALSDCRLPPVFC